MRQEPAVTIPGPGALSPEESFRRLTIGDPALLAALADPVHARPPVRRFDTRTEALLRIGALVALDAPQWAYGNVIGAATRAGAGDEECLAVLAAVAGEVGSARVISAAPRIARATGYDIDHALEAMDPLDHARAAAPARE
jgi:alkylhydroperoxidase/carboxymuconolactone decarboxylase family protein YurZ